MASPPETQPLSQTSSAAEVSDQKNASPSRQPKRFSLRGFTSLLLSLAFLAICVSGTMLFFTPRGRTANWTDWTLLGLDKHQWGSVHVNNSILFVAIAVIHLLLNWSVLMRYIKKKTTAGVNMKKELALAGVLAAVCVAGPIWGVPPFSTLMALNEDIKNYWDANAAQPPVPHAEELTLAELASTVSLSTEQVTTALQEAGYDVSDRGQTIGHIGQQKGVAPNAVFDEIRQRFPNTRGWGRVGGGRGAGGHGASAASPGREDHPEGRAMGQGGGRGQGQGSGGQGSGRGRGQEFSETAPNDLHQTSLADVARAVGLTVDEILAAVIDAGYDPHDDETTLGHLSESRNQTPQDVLDAIRQRFPDTRGWGRLTGGRGGWH